jgi:processive 1,2-diacylglycerol beta-glucosyltransferase
MKRILILYNSIGLGHKSIAENIGYYLDQDGYEVKLVDVLQVEGGRLTGMGAKVYNFFITKAPFIWSFLYLNNWLTSLFLPLRTKVASKNFENTKMLVENFNPGLIISTHTNASGIVAFLKQRGWYKGKFGIAFSDFHLHRYWLYDEADFYLINIKEQKQDMVALGIPAAKIFVCGMTLKPKPEIDALAVRQKLQIGSGDRVVLISSGSQGTGIDQELLEMLLGQPNTKALVICGKNTELFKYLSQKFAGTNIITLGFYKPMDELYAIANIFITKPGGLSVAEALRFNLPVVVSHVLPGQEEMNFEYLEDKGLVMPESINLKTEILEELDSQSFHNDLLENPAKKELFPAESVMLGAVRQIISGP